MSESSKRLAWMAVAYERAFAVYFPDPAKEMAELASAHLAEEGERYLISPHGNSITCAACRCTSNHPEDVANLYCGNCHVFHAHPV
jgi:hypothetical protein